MARKAFCDKVAKMTPAALKAYIHFSMDGVVLTIPPKAPVARQNVLRSDDQFVYRKPCEHNLPELAGHDTYKNQVPQNRMLPLWGGIGPGGLGLVLQHQTRKTDAEEWAEAVDEGCLTNALQIANAGRKCGPWRILCDNESFLRAPVCRAAHRRCKVTLLKLPPKSLDLNPVEQYWAWLRRAMRRMDNADLVAKRAVLGKMAYKARLLRLIKTQKAEVVATSCMPSLLKTAVASGPP